MRKIIGTVGVILALCWVVMVLSCSRNSDAPVQGNALLGTWQRVDKPGVNLSFMPDGSFQVHVAGQPLFGGSYQLVSGSSLILQSTMSPGPITNQVALAGKQLKVTPSDGNVEMYDRVP